MARKLKPDHILFAVVILLALFGVVMVFSSSAVIAKERFGDPNYFALKQIVAAVLGLVLMFLTMRTDYHIYRKPVVVFSVLSIVVGLLFAVFFLTAAANTHRWIQFPGFSFQPSETAKVGLIFFMAYFLEKRKDRVNDVRYTLMPILVVVGLMAGLIVFQPDFGTAVALLSIAAVLLFVAGLDLKWIVGSVAVVLPIFYLLVFNVPYRRERILAFLDPWADPLGRGYQIIQSWYSVGAGGFAGLGFMDGKQKLFYLPEAHTDFIFAVVGEELGLLGTCAVLILFSILVWRGLRTALRAPDPFGFYLALGITMMIGLQAFINMSVVLGLLPTKGIPLPFLSYGGSSFLVMLASVGILLNVSQQSS